MKAPKLTVKERFNKQAENERLFSIAHVKELINQEGKTRVEKKLTFTFAAGVSAVEDWYSKGSNPEIHDLLPFEETEEIEDAVLQILLAIYRANGDIQLQALVGETSFPYLDIFQKALLVGELVGLLADEDVLDISIGKHCYVELGIQLPRDLAIALNKTMYLPPMVVSPNIVSDNHSAGYLLTKKPIVLGRHVHDEPQAYDVINIANSISYSLEIEALQLDEPSSMDFKDEETIAQFEDFVEASREVYKMLYLAGNKFYFPHGFDKRGRLYTYGYHVNLQSMEYKRSMLEFTQKEIIEGE